MIVLVNKNWFDLDINLLIYKLIGLFSLELI